MFTAASALLKDPLSALVGILFELLYISCSDGLLSQVIYVSNYIYCIRNGFINHPELVLQYKSATQLFSVRLFSSKPGWLPNALWWRRAALSGPSANAKQVRINWSQQLKGKWCKNITVPCSQNTMKGCR